MSELTTEQSELERKVFDICDDLTEKGEKLSVRIILTQLEGVKSTSTVHAPFKQWKELRLAKKKQFMENLRFSDKLAEAIADEISKHSSASDKRSLEIAESANAQTQEAIDDLRLLEKRLSNEILLLDQAKKEKAALQKQLDEASKTNAMLVIELRDQLTDQINQNKELAKANESLRTEIAKSELKLEGNENYVSEVKVLNQSMTIENKELNKEIALLSKTIASSESTVSGQSRLIDQLEKSQQQIQLNLQKLERESAELSSERHGLREKLDNANRLLSDSKEKLSDAIRTKEQMEKTIDEQSNVIKKLT